MLLELKKKHPGCFQHTAHQKTNKKWSDGFAINSYTCKRMIQFFNQFQPVPKPVSNWHAVTNRVSPSKAKVFFSSPHGFPQKNLRAMPAAGKAICKQPTTWLQRIPLRILLSFRGFPPIQPPEGSHPSTLNPSATHQPSMASHPSNPSNTPSGHFEKFSRRMAKGATTWMSHTNLVDSTLGAWGKVRVGSPKIHRKTRWENHAFSEICGSHHEQYIKGITLDPLGVTPQK